MTAIEKDDALVEALGGALGVSVADGTAGGAAPPSPPLPPPPATAAPNLRLVHGDALRVHIPAELAALRARMGGAGAAAAAAQPRLVVVANLPYNITTAALRSLLPLSAAAGGGLDAIYLLLQEEAAVRIATARPGTGDWRATSVLVSVSARRGWVGASLSFF